MSTLYKAVQKDGTIRFIESASQQQVYAHIGRGVVQELNIMTKAEIKEAAKAGTLKIEDAKSKESAGE